jgi:CRP/FNR family cyclic AMP-dependent transcriptional regulator
MKAPHILALLSEENLDRLVGAVRVRQFARGEVVFHQGDLAESMHLIVRGRFAVRASTALGDTATLAILGDGDVFGEIELLRHDHRRTVTVASLDASQTLSIGPEELARLQREQPGAVDELLAVVADDVARYANHLLEALYESAEVRVLRRLLEVASLYSDHEILLTQSELARLAGTSRTTVNKVLREEARRGTLRLGRARIEIVDLTKLESRAVDLAASS